eukprot:scaffold9.g3120.t1
MNVEKLQKMAGVVRTGGKGTVRRKKKAVHKTTSTDDKRLQSTLKRLGVNTIPGIEEVLLINADGTALQFNNPKVQASIAANTYVVSGPSQPKRAQDVMASMLAGLGGPAGLQQMMGGMGGMGGMASLASAAAPRRGRRLPARSRRPAFNPEGAADEPEDDDDDVPELVENFEGFAEGGGAARRAAALQRLAPGGCWQQGAAPGDSAARFQGRGAAQSRGGARELRRRVLCCCRRRRPSRRRPNARQDHPRPKQDAAQRAQAHARPQRLSFGAVGALGKGAHWRGAEPVAGGRRIWLAWSIGLQFHHAIMFINNLLAAEVLRWRLAGAIVWQLAILIGVAGTLSLIGSACPWVLGGKGASVWMLLASQAIAQAPAFAAQAAVVSTQEPPPPYLPRMNWPRVAAASVVLHKLAARVAGPAAAARTAAYLALHALSAVMLLSLDAAWRGLGAAWALQFGIWLAVVYLIYVAYWSQDVLAFPTVQRHRLFRLKQRLPLELTRAAQLAAAAWAAALLSSALARAPPLRGTPGWRAAGAGAAAPLLGSLLAGGACAFCWLAGAAVLEAVLTERLRPGDYGERNELAAMTVCLKGGRGPLMRDLALQDLCQLATGAAAGPGGARRAELWADDSGDRWRLLGEACLADLQACGGGAARGEPGKAQGAASAAGPAPGARLQPQLLGWSPAKAVVLAAVAAALPQAAPAAGVAGAGGATASQQSQQRKWNALPAMSVKGILGVSRPQAEALAALRCHYQRAAAAARALAGLAEASLGEDRYGVLQLSQPGLGDVALALLGGLALLRQFSRALAALGPRQLALGPWRGAGDAAAGGGGSQAVDAAALALQDVLTTSLYAVVGTFGEGLRKVVAEAKGAPPVGATKADAAALLERLLRAEE